MLKWQKMKVFSLKEYYVSCNKTGSFAKRVASKVASAPAGSTMIVNEGGGGKRKTIQKKKKLSQKIRLK